VSLSTDVFLMRASSKPDVILRHVNVDKGGANFSDRLAFLSPPLSSSSSFAHDGSQASDSRHVHSAWHSLYALAERPLNPQGDVATETAADSNEI
jgi:hypothetical protein